MKTKTGPKELAGIQRQSVLRRRIRVRLLGFVLSLAAGLTLLPSPVLATNHIVRINEIMVGFAGDPNVQFVEIVANGDGQKLWGPQGSSGSSRLSTVGVIKMAADMAPAGIVTCPGVPLVSA